MSGSFSALKTAVLFSAYGSRASYYDDWLDAFVTADAFSSSTFNIAQGNGRKAFMATVGQFDLVVLLHSVNADNLIYAREILPALQARTGRLLSFVGNEVNLPGAPMAPKLAFLKEAGTDVVVTQLPKEAGDYLYGDTGARVAAVPHALNPDAFQPQLPCEARLIDIGVRSFRYPATFLGDDERNRLIDLFAENPFEPPLTVDISTTRRLDRSGWAAFLNTCKGTVANEAGSYWIEKDDATLNAIKAWVKSQGGGGAVTIASESPLRRLAHKLPWGVRQWLIKVLSKGLIRHEALIGEDIDFEEVYGRFFKSKPFPPNVSGKCVSSRHFDAAGTLTCQIMIEGRYNGIFHAHDHYIPIKHDLSDVPEAVEKFRDVSYRKAMVEQTHEYVMSQHTYKHRIRQIEDIVRSL